MIQIHQLYNLVFAEKVELLKGPGSALYGTSAFFGVMSITPKALSENGVLVDIKGMFRGQINKIEYWSL